MKIQIRKILPESIAAVILIALSAYLLGGDVWTFWTWWLLALFMGMVAMPVTGRLFEGFEDKGWLFSKALAIAVTGFLTWFLVAVKLLPFTAATCIGVICDLRDLLRHSFSCTAEKGDRMLPIRKNPADCS